MKWVIYITSRWVFYRMFPGTENIEGGKKKNLENEATKKHSYTSTYKCNGARMKKKYVQEWSRTREKERYTHRY